MDDDEITYNAFYLLLTNKFRRKYELSISKCWTICVPYGDSLRRVTITQDFVDDHILKLHPDIPSYYSSTDEAESHSYYIDKGKIKLLNSEEHVVNIVSVEKCYNRECGAYNILIVDKPLHPKYRASKEQNGKELELNRSITCYKEALKFLKEVTENENHELLKLQTELEIINLNKYNSAEDLSETLKSCSRHYWAIIMRQNNLNMQRDARFQKLLSKALEIFVMHHMHEKVYFLMVKSLKEDDSQLREKIDQLISINISPDQLGVEDSLAIDLPSAIVELANLDCMQGPWEKLLCLKNSVDLIIAELKGAYADLKTVTDTGSNVIDTRNITRILSNDNLILLLLYVIVKSRTSRLITDLHYIKNFLWSVSPYDGFSYTLTTFEAAVSVLLQINLNDFKKRYAKVKKELHVTDVLKIFGKENCETPLDRQMHCIAVMLKESTQDACKL